MQTPVRIRGLGSVEVAAYGVADAEHLVEKELARLWPGAHHEILEVARPGDGGRVVEEFRVRYRLTATVTVEVEAKEQAPRAAFRHARGLLAGSRYRATGWEKA